MSYASEILADSPVGFWELNDASGNFVDSSGSGLAFDLTPVNSPTYRVAGPITADPNGAAGFASASSQYASHVLNSHFLAVDNFTVEMFIYNITTGRDSVFLTLGDDNVRGYELELNNNTGGNKLSIRVMGVADIGEFTTALSINTWYHVVFQRAATAWKLYINGTQDTSQSSSITPGTPLATDTLSIATIFSRPTAHPINGRMAYVAYYNTALSSARIAAHYAARVAPPEETGAGVAGTVGAGPSASETSEAGFGEAGGVGSGSAVKIGVHVETGFAKAGTVGSGAATEAVIFSESGYATIGGKGAGASEFVLPDTTPPSLLDVRFFANTTVTLYYDEPLQTSPGPDPSEFAVTVNGLARTVTAAAAVGSNVMLTLASPTSMGDTVHVTYVA